MKRFIQLIILFLFANSCIGQTAADLIRKGNEHYKASEFDKASESYTQALAIDPNNNTAKFNKASTDWKTNKPDEAIKGFENLAVTSTEKQKQARAFYNKGAILSKQKKLDESIEAYKNSLRRDPTDVQARENLQKALLEQRKNQPPPKKDDDKKKQEQKKQQQQQPKMNKREAEQKLKLLEQKERELQQRMQSQKTGSGTGKDW